MKTIKIKQTSIPWLGEIPESWDLRRLKFQISKKKGRKPLKTELENKEGYLPYITASSFENYDYKEFVSMDEDLTIIQKSEVIILWDGARAGFIDYNHYGFLSSTMVSLKNINGFNDKYFYYFLKSNQDIFQDFANGTTIPHADGELLDNYYIPTPLLQTQKKIADYLDDKTEKIKKLVEDKKKMIELLKEQMLALATIEQHEGSGSFVRIAHLVTLIKRDVKIEDDEEYVALGLYNRGRGLFHKPNKKGLDMGDSNFFYVKDGDLILSGQFAWEGAVTMAENTENGCVVSHRYPILRGKEIETEYLLILLMTNFGDFLLNESSIGSAGRNRPLNINLLLAKKIRIPDTKIQNKVKLLFYQKKSLEDKIEKQIELIEEYKKSLIYQAVTGKIPNLI